MPAGAGRDTAGIVAAAAAGGSPALVVAGVDPDDLPDPAARSRRSTAAPFVVSLELRPAAVTERADVVFPVAAAPRSPARSSTGRAGRGPSTASLHGTSAADRLPGAARARRRDGRPTSGCPTSRAARGEIAELGAWDGDPAADAGAARQPPRHAGRRRRCWPPGTAARRRPAAGRRAVPRRHRQPPSPASGRPPRPRSASPTGDRVTVSTDRGRSPLPVRDRRHARPRGLAADQRRRPAVRATCAPRPAPSSAPARGPARAARNRRWA